MKNKQTKRVGIAQPELGPCLFTVKLVKDVLTMEKQQLAYSKVETVKPEAHKLVKNFYLTQEVKQ